MSERNGDKARFQRDRKRKVLHRMRIRELLKPLEPRKPAKQDEGLAVSEVEPALAQ
jgi:hypothetical protein